MHCVEPSINYSGALGKMRNWWVALLCLLAVPAYGSSLISVDDLLNRASRAIQEKNYKGRFTYEAGGAMETVEIVHGVVDGEERERVYHLNGVKREFVRSGGHSDCVSAGRFLLRGGLISADGATISLAENYHFYIRGDERIAGRDASVIQAMPKDEYRYGVTLAIDKESNLPLMSLIMANSNSILERFQMVQLTVGIENIADELKARGNQFGELDGDNVPCAKPGRARSAWQAAWVPRGFVISHATEESDKGEAVTYTDGIASFTVFVKAVSDPDLLKEGAARRGATTAYMGRLNHKNGFYSVVLIGEVPVKTAQQVVSSIKYMP